MPIKFLQNDGQACVLETLIALLAVLMLALPIIEYGRMANDGVLAASAAEDAAKAVAANPDMTKDDIQKMLESHYQSIAGDSTIDVDISSTKERAYTHYFNKDTGGHVARPSKVSWRDITVRISFKRNFIFFVNGIIGQTDSKGYVVSKIATAASDQTVNSKAW